MKKAIKIISAVLLISGIFNASASAGQGYRWYCMRKKDHVRPGIEPNMAFLTEHSGYYLGNDEKVIYLTFDAGYENGNVSRIVDTLEKHGAVGAFFVLDNLIERNTDLCKKITRSGSIICNHTCRHHDMSEKSEAEFCDELHSLEETAKKYGLAIAPFYRPPKGVFSKENLIWAEKMGYKTVLWSFAYADWDNDKQPSPEKAIDLIMSNTHNGEIILLHPTSKTNADILDTLLCRWEEEGYRFGSLFELN
ncbi:MAG: polysaccharide deacetylase family protein [Clostridiales bacterium]|nr:polysaccharide deacetylase family protein [Clostridiales bacterium]